MARYQLLLIPLALAAATVPAHAQRRTGSGSPAASSRGAAPAAQRARGPGQASSAGRAAAAGSWNGTPSKWGGSPPRSRWAPQLLSPFGIPSAYLLDGVAPSATAPVLVPGDYPGVAVDPGTVDMQVVQRARPANELTTMDVYRQQRFKKP